MPELECDGPHERCAIVPRVPLESDTPIMDFTFNGINVTFLLEEVPIKAQLTKLRSEHRRSKTEDGSPSFTRHLLSAAQHHPSLALNDRSVEMVCLQIVVYREPSGSLINEPRLRSLRASNEKRKLYPRNSIGSVDGRRTSKVENTLDPADLLRRLKRIL